MKRHWFTLFLATLALLLTLATMTPVLAAPKTLKAVSFVPKNHPLCVMIHVWVERVNEQCKDAVKIDWVGGPEVIPGFDQAEALRNNSVQVAFNPTAYYAPLLQEGNKPIKGIDELKGVKMRTSALYDRMMKKMGIVPVTVQFGETFTALERGLVDGFGWSTLGPADWGWLNNCKYIIDIPFYTRQNTLILMNLDVWNSLGKDVQDKIMDITVKFEPEMEAYFKNKIAEEWKRYDKMGIKRIKFSPEDTKKFLDIAYDAEWEDLEKKVPDLVPTLKKLTGNL
jgi:TRAP-type C4-dicarboxylate transport system substrate-binding protein